MRPGGFSPRSEPAPSPEAPPATTFNEAGGILPPEWSGAACLRATGPPFNEAGGILPPEWAMAQASQIMEQHFNEAGGILPPECQTDSSSASSSSSLQ